MHFLSRLNLAVASLAATATARLVSFSPMNSGGPSYRVGIPTGSTISSTAPGPIYFSLSAPSTYQWVGLGIGEQMAGAHIFVMYADGSGNVTLSARDGNQGHVEPLFNSTLASGVELLEGSGVANGVMTANVRCTTCYLLSSGTSTSSPWIAAWMPGSAINSNSNTFVIAQHQPDATSKFTFDLSQAGLASDTNPFVTTSSTTSPSASSTTGGPAAATSSSSGNIGSSQTVDGATLAATQAKYQKAHGIIMGVTVTLLFPLGASIMRLGGGWIVHSVVQLVSLACLIVGFGLGVKLADLMGLLYANQGRTHTIFGTLIFILFLLQPFGGLIHHLLYKRTGGRTPVSHLHIWLGRVVLICAIINGGLGLQLAANTRGGEIAYGVVAGVVAVAYALLVVFKRKAKSSSSGGARDVHGHGLVEKQEHASSGGGSPVRQNGDNA